MGNTKKHRGPSPDSAKTAPTVDFTAPSLKLVTLYHPGSQRVRDLEHWALTPTLQLYADYFLGKRPAPTYAEVIYATEGGLRHFLLHGLTKQRILPGNYLHQITPEMIAFSWYKKLSDVQRDILREFAVTGTIPARRVTRHSLFAPGA